MKVLIVHPEEDPTIALAGQRKWERVIDLGFAGPAAYERWSRTLGCPVSPAAALEPSDFRDIRDALTAGVRVLVDEYGVDWWDLIALEFHQQLERVARLRKLATGFSARDEIFVSRSGFDAQALGLLLRRNVKCLPPTNSSRRGLRHYVRAISKLSGTQLLQILGDKYDPGYRFRRFISTRRKASGKAVVLLPSAYLNVSKTEVQYAERLPDWDFLLVTTRESGVLSDLPRNVSTAKLASYAPGAQSRSELLSLLEGWHQLKSELMRSPLLSVALRVGVFDSFPKLLRDALRIRDAWLQVFEREPICAVLCADDANFITRIPLMIAVKRGLPGLACHHGALDGRHAIRPQRDSIFLAKSEMERDYLVGTCGSPAEQVVIGAPAHLRRPHLGAQRRSILFFSEPYEIVGGRCSELYKEILPPLAELAASSERELILKLHPMESPRERAQMAYAALSDNQRNVIRIVNEPLTEELLAQGCCAITIASTAAVDCTLAGIPVFLCQWLDSSPYQYARQFAKFGAGLALKSADDIQDMPLMLENWRQKNLDCLYQPISREQLLDLLTRRATLAAAG